MKVDYVSSQLANRPSYDRLYAEAQMARAEALLAVISMIARAFRAGWHFLADPVAAEAKAFTDRRTRMWPHVQAR